MCDMDVDAVGSARCRLLLESPLPSPPPSFRPSPRRPHPSHHELGLIVVVVIVDRRRRLDVGCRLLRHGARLVVHRRRRGRQQPLPAQAAPHGGRRSHARRQRHARCGAAHHWQLCILRTRRRLIGRCCRSERRPARRDPSEHGPLHAPAHHRMRRQRMCQPRMRHWRHGSDATRCRFGTRTAALQESRQFMRAFAGWHSGSGRHRVARIGCRCTGGANCQHWRCVFFSGTGTDCCCCCCACHSCTCHSCVRSAFHASVQCCHGDCGCGLCTRRLCRLCRRSAV